MDCYTKVCLNPIRHTRTSASEQRCSALIPSSGKSEWGTLAATGPPRLGFKPKGEQHLKNELSSYVAVTHKMHRVDQISVQTTQIWIFKLFQSRINL